MRLEGSTEVAVAALCRQSRDRGRGSCTRRSNGSCACFRAVQRSQSWEWNSLSSTNYFLKYNTHFDSRVLCLVATRTTQERARICLSPWYKTPHPVGSGIPVPETNCHRDSQGQGTPRSRSHGSANEVLCYWTLQLHDLDCMRGAARLPHVRSISASLVCEQTYGDEIVKMSQ